MGLNIIIFDILAVFALFAISILFSLAPILIRHFIKNERKRDYFLTLGNVFAGGLFFSAGVVHLLAEANETFTDVLGEEYEKYPFAFMLAPIGFGIAFFVEKILFSQPSAELINDDEESHLKSKQSDHGHSHGVDIASTSIFVPLLLIIIFSLHEFIAGLALGISSETSKALPIFLALITHKWLEAFSVGVALLRITTLSRFSFVRIILAYSATAPLGVIVGAMCRFFEGDVTSVMTGIFTSLAAGTFIYVSLVDIILPEFEKLEPKKQKIIKFVCAALGFIAMTSLQLLMDHEHSHDHDEHDCHDHDHDHDHSNHTSSSHDHDHDHSHDFVKRSVALLVQKWL
eukprot:TRINITY_DN11482_c0_g1_i1.p1 TRINITY_DN11482_c0_g1~~TRINITY_DN11482_c0_g1_i1.p1  ORF type:complete len:344 (+),score=39.65 TRINITY_DN11482_c0_g1_i1:106-1137(+)